MSKRRKHHSLLDVNKNVNRNAVAMIRQTHKI